MSTCKSPQGMLGSMIKTYFAQHVQRTPEEVVYVSVMPCVRKQGEADRDVPHSHSASPDDGVYPNNDAVHGPSFLRCSMNRDTVRIKYDSITRDGPEHHYAYLKHSHVAPPHVTSHSACMHASADGDRPRAGPSCVRKRAPRPQVSLMEAVLPTCAPKCKRYIN